ncbi:MAG: zinc ribbon domain-containing protein [Bacilli bacterium]|nr:zinc ribbon domain-containing protein [Bacilli bacterium]
MSYYCHHCGKEVGRGNKFCPHCGVLLQEDEYGERPGEYDDVVDEPKPAGKKTIINESTKRDLDTVVKILMIVITVLTGFAIIPLLWTIPMTMTALDRIKKKEPYGLVLSICTLLFMAVAPGVVMIIRDADTYTD